MTEQEAKDVLEAYMKCEKRKNNLVYEEKCNNDCDNCELCYEKGTVGEHKEAVEMAIKALEEIKQYRTIGTPEECRTAVEKQKEMIAYCDENDCADCPYHGGSQKENRCMNDFIAEKISKGVCNACIDAIGGGDN